VVEEVLRIIRMLSRLPVPFWMAVDVVLRREDRGFVRRLRVDVKDAGFRVVDPDDSVCHGLDPICKNEREEADCSSTILRSCCGWDRGVDSMSMRSRLLPAFSIFAGGVAYAVLPRGAFGAHDVIVRAAITAAVAAVTCLLMLTSRKRSRRSLG
jgi:hypothetical protein